MRWFWCVHGLMEPLPESGTANLVWASVAFHDQQVAGPERHAIALGVRHEDAVDVGQVKGPAANVRDTQERQAVSLSGRVSFRLLLQAARDVGDIGRGRSLARRDVGTA